MGNLSRVGNDKISSIKIQPGYKVIAYQDDSFQGASRTYKSSISFTSNFNDQISSIKVVKHTSTPPPPPPPAAEATYRVEIDNCHSDLDNEGTGGRITVAFFSGSERVKGIYRDNIGENCITSDASFTVKTNKNITHITVSTNSGDAFYIDEIRLFRNGSLRQHHGRDNGSGWCLSTDPNDANGSWKSRIANGCPSSQRFNY